MERSSTSKEVHAKPKPNKSSTHRKEEDSKQSPGIKAVSIKRPQLYRSKEVDSKQSPQKGEEIHASLKEGPE